MQSVLTSMKYVRLLWPWVAIVLLLWTVAYQSKTNGILQGTITVLQAQNKELAKRAAVERTVFVHDTVRVNKTITKYETLVDSIRTTDTLTVREQIIVAAADTAIRACREVVRSCAENLRVADSLHVLDQRIIRAYQRAQPSFVRRWSERLAWAGAGYTIRSLTK
jgi:type I site-specific restriction endonuclease